MFNITEIEQGFSLDDVLLKPQRSDIESRLDTDLTTKLTENINIKIPICATNMSTICEKEMAETMHNLGGVGFIHRFMPINTQANMVKLLSEKNVYPIVASIGVGTEEYERANVLNKFGVDALLLDVAHAHSQHTINQFNSIRKIVDADIIVGNIATYEAATEYLQLGANALRVGIGAGHTCITRQVTGHGVPNLTALIECVNARTRHNRNNKYVPIIMDGGIRNSGDVVKSLYFGADSVCLGNLLSGTAETPGEIIGKTSGEMKKKFYGMSSKSAMIDYKGEVKNGIAAEGITTLVDYKGSVVPIIEELVGGIRSGLSYSNAKSIAELRKNGYPVLLSSASIYESKLR